MKEVFKKGTICDKCGMSKKEAYRLTYPCEFYGDTKLKHQWNKREITIEVMKVITRKWTA